MFNRKKQAIIVNLDNIYDAIVEYLKNHAILTETNHRYIEKQEDEPFPWYMIMPTNQDKSELGFTGIEFLNPKCIDDLNTINELLNEKKVVMLTLDSCYEIVISYLCSDECGMDKDNVKRINKNSFVITPVA